MLSLTDKIEFMKYLREEFLGKNLKSIDVICVVECAAEFGVVTNIDIADDKIYVWGTDSKLFIINLNDIIEVDYKPDDEDVCLKIAAKNEVEVRFIAN